MKRETLESLEGDHWGEPPAEAGYLVRTVYALRAKPVESLGVEDLRILVGQEVGLDHVMPLALRMLEVDPLAEGDFYPGDLLVSVLRTTATAGLVLEKALSAAREEAGEAAALGFRFTVGRGFGLGGLLAGLGGR